MYVHVCMSCTLCMIYFFYLWHIYIHIIYYIFLYIYLYFFICAYFINKIYIFPIIIMLCCTMYVVCMTTIFKYYNRRCPVKLRYAVQKTWPTLLNRTLVCGGRKSMLIVHAVPHTRQEFTVVWGRSFVSLVPMSSSKPCEWSPCSSVMCCHMSTQL